MAQSDGFSKSILWEMFYTHATLLVRDNHTRLSGSWSTAFASGLSNRRIAAELASYVCWDTRCETTFNSLQRATRLQAGGGGLGAGGGGTPPGEGTARPPSHPLPLVKLSSNKVVDYYSAILPTDAPIASTRDTQQLALPLPAHLLCGQASAVRASVFPKYSGCQHGVASIACLTNSHASHASHASDCPPHHHLTTVVGGLRRDVAQHVVGLAGVKVVTNISRAPPVGQAGARLF